MACHDDDGAALGESFKNRIDCGSSRSVELGGWLIDQDEIRVSGPWAAPKSGANSATPGAPLIVGALATAVSLTAGYGALALLTAALAIISRRRVGGGRPTRRQDATPDPGADPR
jgi:hypothetical protein